MPLKRSIRMKPSPRVARSKKSGRLTGRVVAGSIALGLICVMAAVTLTSTPQTGEAAKIANPDRPLEKAATPAAAKRAEVMASNPGRVATPAVNATATNAPAMDVAAGTEAPSSLPATITGCLEGADEAFRLTDTTGADAPKSRSWKSGFLKKGSASIDIVDAANRLKLRDHVGQRVTVTGTLVNHEMQVRSLKRITASCSTSREHI
jgi:hypothetical protein